MNVYALNHRSSETVETVLAAVADCLRAGGVAVVPTETVYGLVTDWENVRGRERIYNLKRRPDSKLLQMLAPTIAAAGTCGLLADARLERLAQTFWPGPLTVVCHAAGGTSVGLRIPDHPFIQALLHRLQRPLAATSANRSGLPDARTATDAVADLDGQPDIVVDGGPVDGQASSVVSLLVEPFAMLRDGPVSRMDIAAALTAND